MGTLKFVSYKPEIMWKKKVTTLDIWQWIYGENVLSAAGSYNVCVEERQ